MDRNTDGASDLHDAMEAYSRTDSQSDGDQRSFGRRSFLKRTGVSVFGLGALATGVEPVKAALSDWEDPDYEHEETKTCANSYGAATSGHDLRVLYDGEQPGNDKYRFRCRYGNTGATTDSNGDKAPYLTTTKLSFEWDRQGVDYTVMEPDPGDYDDDRGMTWEDAAEQDQVEAGVAVMKAAAGAVAGLSSYGWVWTAGTLGEELLKKATDTEGGSRWHAEYFLWSDWNGGFDVPQGHGYDYFDVFLKPGNYCTVTVGPRLMCNPAPDCAQTHTYYFYVDSRGNQSVSLD
jgi:hypothetical protein